MRQKYEQKKLTKITQMQKRIKYEKKKKKKTLQGKTYLMCVKAKKAFKKSISSFKLDQL